jgi:hypothetical protein
MPTFSMSAEGPEFPSRQQIDSIVSGAWEDSGPQAAEQIRIMVVETVRRALSGWTPSPEAIARYPRIADMPTFIDAYCDCITMTAKEGERIATIELNPERLQEKSISDDLISALEFGSVEIPVMIHLRPLQEQMLTLVEMAARSLASNVRDSLERKLSR